MDLRRLSLGRQVAEVCISLRDPLALYAVFNEVLPHWHPVSQPEECKAGE